MRMLTQMSDPAAATQFSSYLISKGIPNQLEKTASGFSLWILNEDQLSLAGGELAVFTHNPKDPRFESARQASEILREQVKKQERMKANFVDVRQQWAMRGVVIHRPILTYVFIGICVVVFILQTMKGPLQGKAEDWLQIASSGSVHHVIVNDPEVGPELQTRVEFAPEIRHGQVWRLITPIFLHFGLMHIAFNMLWLKDLGKLVEHFRGGWRLLGIVLISAILSNLAQYLVNFDITGVRFGLDYKFGGFSGIVYALLGYCWMRGKYFPGQGLFMPKPILQMMIVWLVVCMVFPSLHVANSAHLVGLLSGMAMGYLPAKIRKMSRQR